MILNEHCTYRRYSLVKSIRTIVRSYFFFNIEEKIVISKNNTFEFKKLIFSKTCNFKFIKNK